MGGSSLGPEVIRRSYGDIEGSPKLHVLDSTDPGAVLEVERAVDLEKTLFVVSSKSGGTVETLSHMKHFYERVGRVGQQFVAVTDPGSPLVAAAKERSFRRVFENDPDIGGPLLGAVVLRARPGRSDGREHRGDAAPLPGGGAELHPLRHQHEQLRAVARRGDGRVRAAGPRQVHVRGLRADLELRPLGRAADRRVHRQGGQGRAAGGRRAARRPGRLRRRPRVRLPAQRRRAGRGARREDGRARRWRASRWSRPPVHGASDLGRIFFFAEFGTAVAGWVLGINAFDQPNVQEAKDNTAKVLAMPEPPQLPPADDERAQGAARQGRAAALRGDHGLRQAVGGVRRRRSPSCGRGSATRRRPRPRSATGRASCTRPASSTRAVRPPACSSSSCTTATRTCRCRARTTRSRALKNAQADGDLLTLRDHGLPAERVRLEGDPAAAVRDLTDRLL